MSKEKNQQFREAEARRAEQLKALTPLEVLAAAANDLHDPFDLLQAARIVTERHANVLVEELEENNPEPFVEPAPQPAPEPPTMSTAERLQRRQLVMGWLISGQARRIRKQADFTCADVAELVPCTPSAVSHWERAGDHGHLPNSRIADKVAMAYLILAGLVENQP